MSSLVPRNTLRSLRATCDYFFGSNALVLREMLKVVRSLDEAQRNPGIGVNV